MIQRNWRLWQFANSTREKQFLNEWKKIERPLVVQVLKTQDEMSKKLNLTINMEPGKRISMKDRVQV